MGSPAWLAGGARTGRDALLTPFALALAGARAAVDRPAGLVALAVLLVCVPSPNSDVTASVHVTAPDIGSAALVAAAIAGARGGRWYCAARGGRWHYSARGRWRPGSPGGGPLPPSRVWLGVGATVLAFALSALGSVDPLGSLSGFVRYTQLFVVVPVAVALSLRSRADIRLVCAAVLAAAVIQAVVGTTQYVTGTGASYGGHNVRAVGTFSALDVMGMATVVGYGVVVAVGLALVLRATPRLALLVLAGALIVALLLTLSRGAVVSTAVAAAVMVLVAGRQLALRTAVYGGAAAVVLTGAIGAGNGGVAARFATIGSATSTPDRSVQDRYDLWRAAIEMWRDHPVTGVGLKEFAAYRDSYAPLHLSSGSDVADAALAFQREPLLSPHNMYLLVLSEQGVVGLLGLFGLLFAVAVMAVRRTVQARDRGGHGGGPPDGRLPDARLGSVVAVGIIAWTLVDFLYGDIGGQSTVLMSILLGVPLWWATRPAPEPEPGGRQ